MTENKLKRKKINKTAIFLIALLAFLACACAVCMTIKGHTYTYNINNGFAACEGVEPEITVENDKVVTIKEASEKEIVFESVSKGNSRVTVLYNSELSDGTPVEISFSINLHVTSAGVIINQTDLDFNGYTTVVYAAFIYLAAVLVCIFLSAKRSFKENFYSYKSILNVGLFIFAAFLLLMLIMQISVYWTNGINGLYSFISTFAYCADNILVLLFPVIVIIFILISISNVVLLKREGIRANNALGAIIGIAFAAASIGVLSLNYLFGSGMNTLLASYMILSFVRIFLCFLVVYLDCIFLAACICAGLASKRKVAFDKDFIIVLGCGINKDGTLTPLLKGRTDKALDFAKNQFKGTGKKCVIIPSGGQGIDEVISEGEAMKRYLLEQNVPNEDIMAETCSANTFENMTFSKKLADSVKANASLVFATTNYHLFRSGLIANEAGIKIDGIGSRTKWYFWPNAFLREFAGVMKCEIKYHIKAAAMIFVVSLILIFGLGLLFSAL